MLRRLRNATAAMKNMTREQERVSNNLANADTVGYKRDRIFTEALNERIDADGNPRSDRRLTQAASTKQGSLQQTGNPLDAALNGDGFFVVSKEGGAKQYTRAGRFLKGADGTLRTPAGMTVQGRDGPIQIPEDAGKIQIAKDGSIRAGRREIGRLRVVTFDKPGQLPRREDARFAAGAQTPQDMQHPHVKQGFIENSNVSPMLEMTDMIKHFRLFESQQRMIRSTDQALGRAMRTLGRF